MTADDNSNASEESAGEDRVAKVLARAGVASRREIERMIADGRVALNGVKLTTPAVKVAASDVLTVDGKRIGQAEAARVWRYHKPAGLVTTHSDPKGRPTVFENLPPGLPRVISVGRLDLSTEGLLLLTNDGELARALELPATGLIRRYRARARGRITQERLDTLKDGITVDGIHYGSIDATLDKAKEGQTGVNLWISLTLSEGKNREVRKVLEALGLTVNRLIRLSYGPFQLGEIASGQAEEVGPRVIREQLGSFIPAERLPEGNSVPKPKPVRAARADGTPEKTYKPGWAKPKIKPKPHPKPRPKAGSKPDPKAEARAEAKAAAKAGAKPTSRPGSRFGAEGKSGARPTGRGPGRPSGQKTRR